jgi:hypothetical protein
MTEPYRAKARYQQQSRKRAGAIVEPKILNDKVLELLSKQKDELAARLAFELTPNQVLLYCMTHVNLGPAGAPGRTKKMAAVCHFTEADVDAARKFSDSLVLPRLSGTRKQKPLAEIIHVVVGGDNHCELGKRLHGAGRVLYGHLPEYEQLLKKCMLNSTTAPARSSTTRAAWKALRDTPRYHSKCGPQI